MNAMEFICQTRQSFTHSDSQFRVNPERFGSILTVKSKGMESISHYITVQLNTSLTLFISSQHPDLDVSFSQLLYGLWHAILQLVLHSCRSQKLKTPEYRVAS